MRFPLLDWALRPQAGESSGETVRPPTARGPVSGYPEDNDTDNESDDDNVVPPTQADQQPTDEADESIQPTPITSLLTGASSAASAKCPFTLAVDGHPAICDSAAASVEHVLKQHIEKDAELLKDPRSKTYFARRNKWVCPHNCRAYGMSTTKCRCHVAHSPDTYHTFVAVAAPPPHAMEPPDNINNDIAPFRFLPCGEAPETTMLQIRTAECSTVKYVPNQCKALWSTTFHAALRDANRDPSIDHIARLQMLPKCVLRRNPAGSQTQTRFTRQCLNNWRQSDQEKLALWNDLVNSVRLTFPGQTRDTSTLRRCRGLIELGRLGDACRTLQSSGINDFTAEVIAELQDKHPQHDGEWATPDLAGAEPLTVTWEEVNSALKSFPKDSACGNDGLRAEHIRAALAGASVAATSTMEGEITTWINKMLSGRLQAETAQFVASAPLIPLRKQGGDTRPIAVGEVWRRLASKCAARRVQGTACQHLKPMQVGVAVRNGAESVILEAQHFVDTHKENPGKVLLLLDFKNAFNSIHRDKMFEQVRQHVPSIAPWVEFCYSKGAILYAGKERLRSSMGVQQGDPLGPLLFALTIHPILIKVQQECRLDFFRWYLDDGTIGGDVEQVAKAKAIILEEGAKIGLVMNNSKCQVWWPTQAQQYDAFPGIKHVVDQGVVLLGGPVGSPEFANTLVRRKTEEINKLLDSVKNLEHAQYILPLYRHCLGFPKSNHLFRVCDPDNIQDATKEFDNMFSDHIGQVCFNRQIDDPLRQLIGLPIKRGGLGLTCASTVGRSCYTGCLAQVVRYADQLQPKLEESLRKWNDGATPGSAVSLQDLLAFTQPQHALSERIYQNISTQFRQQIDTLPANSYSATRLRDCLSPKSGLWLATLPIQYNGLRMSRDEYAMALKFRYGVPVRGNAVKCPHPDCRQMADKNGTHDSICGGGDNQCGRHNLLRDAVYNLAISARLSARREPDHLIPGSNAKPADVFIQQWRGDQTLCVDLTVANAYSRIDVVAHKEAEKNTKYLDDCRREGLLFSPFIITNTGVFGEKATAILRVLAVGMAHRFGLTEGVAITRVRQKLQFIAMRQIGQAIVDRLGRSEI